MRFTNATLALHVHDLKNLQPLLRKFYTVIKESKRVWISSSNNEVLKSAESILLNEGVVLNTFLVDNRWLDWSGYLTFFKYNNESAPLIVANDSLLTRRFVSDFSIKKLLRTKDGCSCALIGDLDTASISVLIGGTSSACWISTYLFIAVGIKFNPQEIELKIISEVQDISKNPNHPFNIYLKKNRSNVYSSLELMLAKIGSMCFERYLTQVAINQGGLIIDAFAGYRLRKIEKFFESLNND